MKKSLLILLTVLTLTAVAVPIYAQDTGLTLQSLAEKVDAMIELVTSLSDRVNSFEQRLAALEATATPTVTHTPTPTSSPTPTQSPTPTYSPTPPATPTPQSPTVSISRRMNVRAGPGTTYPIVGQAPIGAQYLISGRNPGGGWWQIIFNGQYAWIYSPFVTAYNTTLVQVATNIPTPVPTPRPPTPIPAPTQPPAPQFAYSVTSNGNCPRNDQQTYFEGKVLDRNNNPVSGVCLHVAFNGPRNTKCTGCGKPAGQFGFSPFGGRASSGTFVEIYIVNCPAGGWDGSRTNSKDFSNLTPLSQRWTRTIGESIACTDITFKQN